MFHHIANISIDQEMNPATIQQILTGSTVIGMAEEFSKLKVALNEPPWIPAAFKGTCKEDDYFGSFISRPHRQKATVVVCPMTLTYPLPSEILESQPWAFDAQGKLLEGYGCDGLLDRDTEYMQTPGGFILHELIHWSYLFEEIEEWERFVVPFPGEDTEVHLIEDFPGPTPPSGYGCYRTALIKQRGVTDPDEGNPFPALNNADNYMWYAVSKYFGWACNKEFGGAREEADNRLRTKEWQNMKAIIPPNSDHPQDNTQDLRVDNGPDSDNPDIVGPNPET